MLEVGLLRGLRVSSVPGLAIHRYACAHGEVRNPTVLSYSGLDPRHAARALIVAAHPDDEIIGLGAALRSMGELMIVHVTDGAPVDLLDASAKGFDSRPAYARTRRNELISALEFAELKPELHCLGIVDQHASFELPRITEELNRIIDSYAPEVVWTHPYEGGHPDHDACAFCVREAAGAANIAEFTSYHAGPNGIVTGEFLPSTHAVITHQLSAEEHDLKSRMFRCFETQREMLSQFGLDVERYRWAPQYDFTAPPHEGRLYYENYPWGVTGARFRELVRSCSSQTQEAGR